MVMNLSKKNVSNQSWALFDVKLFWRLEVYKIVPCLSARHAISLF